LHHSLGRLPPRPAKPKLVVNPRASLYGLVPGDVSVSEPMAPLPVVSSFVSVSGSTVPFPVGPSSVSVSSSVPVSPPLASPARSSAVSLTAGARRPKRKVPSSGFRFVSDRLGKLVSKYVHVYQSSSSWPRFVHQHTGRSHISRRVRRLKHRASRYLDRLRRQGAAAKVLDPAWSEAKLLEKLARGPHKSAVEHVEFVRDEMANFCEKGFWTVLPYDLVKDRPGFRLSPLGVIPQRDRRPRLIVDLSFWGVNDATARLAPSEAMQFGRTLERLLYRIRHADPQYGPVYMSKIDISDGFYRVRLAPDDALSLAVVLPQVPGEPPLVAIPFSLPMGWVESPPYFCAVTETAADVANQRMNTRYAPPHHLEGVAAAADETTQPFPSQSPVDFGEFGATVKPLPPPPAPVTSSPLPHPLAYTDPYVDDFCNLVQGNRRRRRMVRRIIMHAIDDIFRPLSPADGPQHKEPISVKKLQQGDGAWQTRKILLGWLIDSIRHTLELPAHRVARLEAIFAELRGRRRVSVKQWHKVLGELRSMVLAIPGGRGLFSILQTGFRYSDRHRIRIDSHLRAQLDDFELLSKDLGNRPTRLAEIIPDAVAAIGAVDASGTGMGGVWFTVEHRPIVWRARFPPDIQSRLVSFDNPSGDLTNSDFELTGVVAHQDVLAQHHDVRECTIGILNDNTLAISRSKRKSVTTRDAAAYLLRTSSLHQRHFRYNATFDHIAGKSNPMADDASRLFHLSNRAFLSHFTQHYPQPLPWKLCLLRPAMNSALISALRTTRVDPQSFLNEPTPATTRGLSGKTFVWSWPSTRSSNTLPTPSTTSWYSPSVTAMAASQKMATPFELEQWRMPYAPSVRRWPGWGPRIID